MKDILVVEEVKKHFRVGHRVLTFGQTFLVKAVDGVSVDLKEGETLGLVGESGCGKTTFGFCITGIEKVTSGRIIFGDTDVTRKRTLDLRKNIQMVFQDPKASFNPRLTILESVRTPLELYEQLSREEMDKLTIETLALTGVREENAYRYPHELSGGQLQRAAVARAIITRPKLIVLDEPTSALDVSVRAQILNLLRDLQRRFNLTYVFITHDISVIKYISERVGVMYLGKIVELADKAEIFKNPLHPYTISLFSSVALPEPTLRGRKKMIIGGEPPSPIHIPAGCRFRERCPFADSKCAHEEPSLTRLSGDHYAACYKVEEVRKSVDLDEFFPWLNA